MSNVKDLPWLEVIGSEQIRSYCYNAEKEKLFLKFINKSVYSYEPVAQKLFRKFIESPSKGSVFHKDIKKLKTTKHDVN